MGMVMEMAIAMELGMGMEMANLKCSIGYVEFLINLIRWRCIDECEVKLLHSSNSLLRVTLTITITKL